MSKYDELKTYLPDFYESIADVRDFLKALGLQMDEVHSDTMQARDNNFIFLADEKTVSRLEQFMYIPYDPARTLDERKRLVASFFVGFGKMSASKIKDIVYTFTNAASDVFFQDSTVSIEIERGTSASIYLIDLDTILSRRIPAHLPFVLVIKYTVETTISAKTSGYLFNYPLTNTLKCGTHPESATLGKIESADINVSADVEEQVFDYKLCGTTPDISTLGFISGSNINTDCEPVQQTFDYVLCGTRRCGQ